MAVLGPHWSLGSEPARPEGQGRGWGGPGSEGGEGFHSPEPPSPCALPAVRTPLHNPLSKRGFFLAFICN